MENVVSTRCILEVRQIKPNDRLLWTQSHEVPTTWSMSTHETAQALFLHHAPKKITNIRTTPQPHHTIPSNNTRQDKTSKQTLNPYKPTI